MMLVFSAPMVAEGETTPGQTDYELYYPQFVDSKEPLSVLQDKDLSNWVNANIKHPILTDAPDPNRQDYFNVPYGTDPLQNISIHHLKGNKMRPVIFYIHGGGWNNALFPEQNNNSRYAVPTWVALGYTVVAVNYRLAPKDLYPAQIEDCAMALKWVMDNIKRYNGNPNKIAVTGESSGGNLAALLVTGTKWHQKYNLNMNKVKCWIPISGVHDFSLKENYYLPLMQVVIGSFLKEGDKTDASPVAHVTGKEPPSLVIHGGDDWLVPRSNSIGLYQKLIEKGAKSELQIIKGYWHCNTIVNYGEHGDIPTQLINKFLAKYLPTSENNLGGCCK
ncbi:MAG: alpha/beta hydrolase [Clostridia bacterium]|nr:alpha/beta hydrolase [Clostridia bacterium]